MCKKCKECGKTIAGIKPSRFERTHFCSRNCYDTYRTHSMLGVNNPSWSGGFDRKLWRKLYQKSDRYKVIYEEYVKRNREKLKKYKSEWYLGRKDKELFSAKMRYSLKRDEILQRNKKWREANKPLFSIYSRNRRALKLNASGSLSLKEWEDLRRKFNYMCLCCKKQEPFIKLTVDHIIPLSRGGSNDISNIQPLCGSCNSRKNVSTVDFIRQISPDYATF